VLSSYRVCHQQFDAGTQTVTAQQIRLLQAKGITNPKPRTAFLDDLIQQIKTWQCDNKEIIICMDANDPLDDPRADISRLFHEMDVINLHYHKYPGARKPATQQRGRNSIDLIAGSLGAAEAMVHAWICPFGEPAMIKGDHHLLGIDFDPDVLFGNALAPPTHLMNQGVNSQHEQKVTKFCKRMVSQCNQHQLAERLIYLKSRPKLTPTDLDELESIDQQLMQILIKADNHCKPPHPDPWSPELDQTYLRHRLWTIKLTAHRNQWNMSAITNAIQARLCPSPDDEDAQT